MGQYSSSKNFNYGYPTPGPQSPTGKDVMNHVFFASETEWKSIRENEEFDYIVIGTGFCALAFIERILKNNPFSRILILERGEFFLPEHFQNLPLPYKGTLGGMSETFPWTITQETRNGKYINFQHGMVPFFGGRSTLWSGWCPRPTRDEMENWPEELIETLEKYFPEAEQLLNVIPADQIRVVRPDKPVYGLMQKELQKLIFDNLNNIPALTRAIPAPLAVNDLNYEDIDFSKFSTPSSILEVAEIQKLLSKTNSGSLLKIATGCIVNQIIQQNGVATALDTSRGIVNIGDAKLILAMGTLPPTTLIRNSFPFLKNIGERFTSHFISAVVARIHKNDFDFYNQLAELELGAFYVAGINTERKNKGQFHIQLTALNDKDPIKNSKTALRYMPDVVATASMEQLLSSEDYIVFVCAVLGELDFENENNWFRANNSDQNPTTNSILQVIANKNDYLVWETMDESTFKVLENILSPKGPENVQYWDSSDNSWKNQRPEINKIRVPGLVHEASTMWIGTDSESIVDLKYKVRGVENIYITGASLWPTGASWNPTLTMVALSQHLADNLSNK